MAESRNKQLAVAGLVAAVYIVISSALLPFSFVVYQVRIAEALTVLPFLTAAAIPGLYIGCLLANVIGGMGWMDIVFGSLLTLLAAMLTRWVRNEVKDRKWQLILAPLPPVLLNAFGVSIYLAPLLGFSYWFSVQMIAVGQLISCYVLGLPLLLLLEKRKFFN